MEKIKSFLKKNMKISITIFTIMICSLLSMFLSTGQVSAEELTQFCDYTEPCISTEMIDNWVKNSDMDTSFYDSYLVFIDYVYSGNTYYKYLNIVFYNSEISTIKYDSIYDENTYEFTISQNDLYYIENRFFWNDSSKKYDFTSLTLSYGRLSKAAYIDKNMYYSNQDLKDTDGNVILKANSIDIPKEDENVVNNRNFLEKFTNFTKQIYTIESNLVGKIVTTPLLMLPFGLAILLVVIAIFYKLFTRR